MGFFAIVKSSTGDPLTASYAIFIAAMFDMLDGRAARLTGNESRFGAEYDSIADTVSFGVAPAVIAFHSGGFPELGWSGWVMAFIYTACASLRLARFNVTAGKYRGRFDGLPSPSAAGMLVSVVWLREFLIESGIHLNLPAILPALGVAAIGLLMVSPIPYRSGKDIKLRGSFGVQVAMVILFIVLILEPKLSFFLVGIAYTSSGPIEAYWRYRTGRTLEAAASEGPPVAESKDLSNVAPLVAVDGQGKEGPSSGPS